MKTWQVISPSERKDGKTFWSRIGSAWQRDDGGFSIQLDSLPLTGKILISPPREPGERDRPSNKDDAPW